MTLLLDLSKRPYRHSYSSLKLYEECPFRYALRYIQKLTEEATAAMDRGTRLHKLAEDYMTATPDVPVPYDIRKLGLRMYQLRERGAKPERTWLLDKHWEPVETDEHAKLKAIVDVHLLDNTLLMIHDYKSGRDYASHADQLEFYAAIGLCRYPEARRCETSALYFDSGHEGHQRSIIREMLPSIIARWDARIGRLDSDERFLPSAGSHCKRCLFGVSKGGPCDAEQR